MNLCFSFLSCPSFEFLREWHVIEKGPWVIELMIPGSFQVPHRLNNSVKLLISNQRQQSCIDSC